MRRLPPKLALLSSAVIAALGAQPFTALAQGLLTDKYLDGIPANARINRPGGGSFSREMLTPENLARVRSLDGIAKRRGQTLAQMAYAWVLRDPRVTTTLIGASSVEQLRENVAALANLSFSAEELAEIDRYADSDRPRLLSSRFTRSMLTNTSVVVMVTSRHQGHSAPISK